MQLSLDISVMEPQQPQPNVPKRRGSGGGGFKFCSRLLGRPQGPTTAAEAVLWPRADIEALGQQGMKWFKLDFGARLADALRDRGLCIRTDYSGMGSAEEAIKQASKAIEEVYDLSLKGRIMSQRAGDMLMVCQKILAMHVGEAKPQCIHGNMLDRMSPKDRAHFQRLRKKSLQRAESRADAGEARNAAFQVEGRKFLYQAMDFILPVSQGDISAAKRASAKCMVHQRSCPVLPPRPHKDMILMNVSGINCYDWSSMGLRKQWLGDSAVAFAQWARERYVGGEDFIVVECTLGFDDEALEHVLKKRFTLTTLLVSPTLFGDPVDRQRKYMVLLRKGQLAWLPEVANFEGGAQGSFERIYAREMAMSGIGRFRAPQHLIDEHIERMAMQRGLPKRRGGKPWSFFQAMCPGMQASVKSHEKALQQMGKAVVGPSVCNLVQRPEFSPPQGGTIPALLRNSRLWNFAARRCAHPLEHLEFQGYNIFGASDGDTAGTRGDLEKYKCEFSDSLSKMSDSGLRKAAGNAMHLRVVAAVVCFTIACTERGGKRSRGD